MSIEVRDSGTDKTVESVYAQESGTDKEVQEVIVNDSGTDKTVFQAGLAPGYYYSYGDEGDGWSQGYTEGMSAYYTKNSDNLEIAVQYYVGSSSAGTWVADTTVDTSSYTAMHMKYECYSASYGSFLYFGIHSNKNNDPFASGSEGYGIATSGGSPDTGGSIVTKTWDISGLSMTGYPYAYAEAVSSGNDVDLYVYEIWFD